MAHPGPPLPTVSPEREGMTGSVTNFSSTSASGNRKQCPFRAAFLLHFTVTHCLT